MEVPSLKPELGVELFKLVILRESYLRRLRNLTSPLRAVDLQFIGLVDVLRETTTSLVETLDEWEKSQIEYPNIVQFTWNGENYMEKMKFDLDFLNDNPLVVSWLQFSLTSNPFLVPLDTIDAINLENDAFLLFGVAPSLANFQSTTKQKVLVKSPYLAPIINDPEIFSNLSAKSRLEKAFKSPKESAITAQDVRESAALYQCFLSVENIVRIRKCLNKLYNRSLTLSTSVEVGSSATLEKEASVVSLETVSTQFKRSGEVWSPHDIQLQRQIERRGGELYVLTVAGTKGRIKEPRRSTRFQRLINDIHHLRLLSDHFGMMIEDLKGELMRISSYDDFFQTSNNLNEENSVLKTFLADLQSKQESYQDIITRLQFMNDCYRHFKIVTEEGKLTELDTERQRHGLIEGQAREEDQLMSVRLEERMVRKIQLLIRRTFGKALRRAEIQRRVKAAMKLQSSWRMSRVNKSVKLRIQQLRLAFMVQRLYRIRNAAMLRKQLQLEAAQRSSALLVQRVYRGYLGRRRLKLKRRFINALRNARNCVSLIELKPSDIECLADVIEDYIRDYTVTLPLQVLTILRGILFLFNGENSECIVISNDEGYQERKFIYASNCSWQGVKLVLRRKGRFLRRLRALIQNSCLPNPSKIVLSADCRIHLKAIHDDMKLSDLLQSKKQDEKSGVAKETHCLSQLYSYLVNVYVASDLQELFPEYFEPGLPTWFRSLMKLREDNDRAALEQRTESTANHRIEDVKKIHAREGKKYNHISRAVHRNRIDLENATTVYKVTKKRYFSFINELNESETRQLSTLDAIVRAKDLAKSVSEGDLKEYMKAALIPDEAHVKELQFTLDAKTIGVIQAKTDLLILKETFARNQSFRDFEKSINMDHLLSFAESLGKIKGDLLILSESWQALLHEIGGLQYVADLTGEKLQRFLLIKTNVESFLILRRNVLQKIENELRHQYNKMFKIVLDTNASQIGKKWDHPSPVEIEHEENENRECCKRDYELEFRKRRQLEIVTIKEPFPWNPMLIILDSKLPRSYLSLMEETLTKEYSFKKVIFDVEVLLKRNDRKGEIQAVLQNIINDRCHLLLVAHRGFHSLSASIFDNFFSALLNVLIPKPSLAYISAEESYQANPFHEQCYFSNSDNVNLSIVNASEFQINGETFSLINSYDVYFGKLRKVSKFLRILLQSQRNKEGIEIQNGSILFPSSVISSCQQDFTHFLLSLQHVIKKEVLPDSKSNTNPSNPAFLNDMSIEESSDLLLSMNLAIIWKLFTPSLNDWSFSDLKKGAVKLRLLFAKINADRLCDLFDLIPLSTGFSHDPPCSSFLSNPRETALFLKFNNSFSANWKYLTNLSFYQFPFRYLLTSWIVTFQKVTEL
jgi:hypothetical protein